MIETFVALLSAHALADFVLQGRWIMQEKRRLLGMAVHAILVAFTAALALGMPITFASDASLAVLIATLAHVLIDRAKISLSNTRQARSNPLSDFQLFLLDQLAHVTTLGGIAVLCSQAWSQGHWGSLSPATQPLALAALSLLAGSVLVVRAGGFVVDLLLKGLQPRPSGPREARPEPQPDDGLPGGGAWIGMLERSLILFLVLVQQFEAIGFLIAAKSILRFRTDQNRSFSETVIIGTLASFTWAIVISWITLLAITHFLQ